MWSHPALNALIEGAQPLPRSHEAQIDRARLLVVHGGYDETPEAHASLRPNLAIVRVVGLVKPHDATGNIEESGGGLNVPVVFLGAPVDLALVRPIKGSNFCGYLLEPFDDLELDDWSWASKRARPPSNRKKSSRK